MPPLVLSDPRRTGSRDRPETPRLQATTPLLCRTRGSIGSPLAMAGTDSAGVAHFSVVRIRPTGNRPQAKKRPLSSAVSYLERTEPDDPSRPRPAAERS